MKRIILGCLSVVFICGLFLLSALAQTTAIIVKPTAKLYEKPNARLKPAQTLKRGRTLKLQSTKPVRGWYQVTVMPEGEPQNEDEAFENLLDEYRVLWINGSDIKIEKDSPDTNKAELKDEWIEFARANESNYSYNPARVTRRGTLIQVWTEERDDDDELLSKTLYEINCQSSKIRSLAGIKYTRYQIVTYPDGKTEKVFLQPTSSSWDTPNSRFTVIIPDSIAEALLRTVCKK
jgi:hypothetical protein